jgi:uncharacterized protein (TIGR03437 family)
MKKLQVLTLASLIGTISLSAAPTIATLGVKNAASYSYPGFPNGAIARGSLFVLFGTAVGPDPIQYAGSPLPSDLAGTSISVTVNGSTASCPMIYTSSGQLAAIMPSTVPAGTGTMTVTYNGTSNAAPITVVNSSPGIFTVNQQGTGPAIVQDAAGHQNGLTAAFNPGQTVVVWLTGLGPISGSDAGVPPSGNLPNVTVTANVGGKAAVVQYAGRSAYAGEDQVNITLPAGVTGCYVQLYLTAAYAPGAAVTSNFGTISIAASGTTCSDPNFPNISGGNGYRFGSVSLDRSTTSLALLGQTFTTNSDSGNGAFIAYDAATLNSGNVSNFIDVTVGSCSVIQSNGTVSGSVQYKNLDAGPVINVVGPNGAKQMPQKEATYSATFGSSSSIPGLPASPLYLDPGNYTVDNGNGGIDVGPFKLNLVVPPTFKWTNQDAITNIDRTQPLQITWSGGDPNAQVQVLGGSSAGSNATVSFFCYGKVSDLSLTVPPAILSLLPVSTVTSGSPNGLLIVTSSTSVSGTARGLDQLTGSVSFGYPKVGVAYK